MSVYILVANNVHHGSHAAYGILVSWLEVGFSISELA